ncbi:Protein NDR1, partial [Linum perenne]
AYFLLILTICCRWCSSFLITSGFTALFLWLNLCPSSPNTTSKEERTIERSFASIKESRPSRGSTKVTRRSTKGGKNGNATRAILWCGTTARFQVKIEIQVRYKLIFFKTKSHQIAAGADFEVNGEGIGRGGGRRQRGSNEEAAGERDLIGGAGDGREGAHRRSRQSERGS